MTLRGLLALLLWLLTGWSTSGAAQPPSPEPERYLHARIPDLALTDQTGRSLSLSDLWSEGPVVITLVSSQCGGLCSPLLRSLVSASAGSEGYKIVVLSFDPRDGVEQMARLSRSLGVDSAGWTLAVTSPQAFEELARSVGFWVVWDESSRQFDHPGVVMGVRDGRLVHLLIGGVVSPASYRLLEAELAGDFIGSYPLPGYEASFRCLTYEPGAGQVGLDTGILLLFVPGCVTILVTVWIFRRPRRSTESLLGAEGGAEGPRPLPVRPDVERAHLQGRARRESGSVGQAPAP